MNWIELDGSAGEGGGQILRSGLALAMCTGQGLRIDRIRARRPKPGLMRQHLASVRAAQAVCGARVTGDELGSTALTFEPGPVVAGEHRFAVGSAGSCTLVLQTVLPALLSVPGDSLLTLSGGTHNPLAPPYQFLVRSFLPLLRRAGADVEVTLRRHGFYPAGGGEIEVVVRPPAGGLVPFDVLARGEPTRAFAECVVAAVPRHVADRELAAVADAFGWDASQCEVLPTRQNEGPGNALLVTLGHAEVTEVFMALGERGRSAEAVAAAVVNEARAYQQAAGAVGPHLADQLALPLALAVCRTGTPARYTVTEVTEHTRTHLAVIARFLPLSAEVDEQNGMFTVVIAPRAG